MDYGGTLKLIFNAQTKKTMQLPDIEYFLLQVKHKHNIYIYQQKISVIKFTKNSISKRRHAKRQSSHFFLITRAWSWGSFVKLGLSITVLATL